MSTKFYIDPRKAPKEVSPIRAAALCLLAHPKITEVDINKLYDLAATQPTSIVTDVPMANPSAVGLTGKRNKIIANFTGQDTARSAWARRFLPSTQEIEKNPALQTEKEKYEKLVREVNYMILRGDFGPFHKRSFYIGKNKEYMIKLNYVFPAAHAKLAFDLEFNFIPVNPETTKIYESSAEINIPDPTIVCVPEWENPEWHAWMARVNPKSKEALEKDPEPPRIIMLFDRENHVAYLLGGRYFGESKKTSLSMAWNIPVLLELGMPVHGSSKTLFTKKENSKELKKTSFITIGLSGSGKSTIGNDPHHEWLDKKKGEKIHLGNDDALVILFNPKDKERAVLGLETGLYNKSNDYAPDSFYMKTVQTAENCSLMQTSEGKTIIVHEDVFVGNGRVESDRSFLEGADENFDIPWPDYYGLIMKDETLPPVMLIEDHDLFVAMYMSLATRSTTAENISVEERKKLKIIPGAQPFNLWSYNREAELIHKTIKLIGFKGLVLNTASFFVSDTEQAKVPKELTLSLYPLLARGELKFAPWDIFPGAQIPAKGALEKIYKGFDEKFTMAAVKNKKAYFELAKQRIDARIDFMKKLNLDEKYYSALIKVKARIEQEKL